VLRATAEEFAPAAVAKKIALVSDLDRSHLVMGDRERLHQVFSNLLSNALKFTPEGGRVTLACRHDGDDVVATVRDTGDGIGTEFVPRLFDRFTQADTSSTRRYGGLGLGLAIVRYLVELHGGTVSAESEGVGRGATFSVRLPVALVDGAMRPSAAEPRRESPRLTGVEILLVEDDRDSLDAMTLSLKAVGAAVRPATSVREAWSSFTDRPPDVVVSDLSMPTEDGYALIQRIRGDGRSVPAIALTGFTRPEDRTRVLAAGFAAHVAKPIDPDELVKVLVRVLARQSDADVG
jgi:CheY-like chemotaxis protein/anti-sigma regulatory factor (Ser/Thr protein kinase)